MSLHMPCGESGVSLVGLRDLPISVNHISTCAHQDASRIDQSCNQETQWSDLQLKPMWVNINHPAAGCGSLIWGWTFMQLGLSPPHYCTGTTPRYWRLKGLFHHSEGSGMLDSPQCLYSSQGLDPKMLLLSNLAYSQKVILKNFHLVFPFYQSRILLCDVSKISYQSIKDR